MNCKSSYEAPCAAVISLRLEGVIAGSPVSDSLSPQFSGMSETEQPW